MPPPQLQVPPIQNIDPFVLPDTPSPINVFGPKAVTNEGGIVLRQAEVKGLPKCILTEKGFRVGADRENGLAVTAEYFVPWTTVPDWVDYMLGFARTSLDPTQPAPDGLLLRTIPYQCPEPRWVNLFCVSVQLVEACGFACQSPFTFVRNPDGSFDPETDAAGNDIFPPKKVLAGWPMWLDNEPRPGGNRDGWARYTATFRALPFRVRTDAEVRGMVGAFPNVAPELQRWVIRKRKQSLAAQPLPLGKVKFLDLPNTPAIPDNASFLLTPTAEITWQWEDLPDPPYSNADNVQGMVNDAVFDGARGAPSYAAATLLCQAPQFEELSAFTTGRIRWRATYTALYRPQGWNKMVGPDGKLHPVGFDAQTPLFAAADFNQLFRPPTPVQYQ